MNFKFVTSIFVSLFMVLFMSTFVIAQEFERGTSIPVPEPEINTGGVGNTLTNVDLDEDGRVDFYWINVIDYFFDLGWNETCKRNFYLG